MLKSGHLNCFGREQPVSEAHEDSSGSRSADRTDGSLLRVKAMAAFGNS
jgi:hypothetical protein